MDEAERATDEPVFTRRLQLGSGLLCFGLGLLFLSSKVLPAPVPAGIATGISLAVTGFVVVVVEALSEPRSPDPREPPGPAPASAGDPAGR